MNYPVIEILLFLTFLYVIAGLLFAIYFVFRGVRIVDPDAEEARLGFRLTIIPGVIAFWPLLLRRVRENSGILPMESTAHKDILPEINSHDGTEVTE